MEQIRCARCRNRIRPHQASVSHFGGQRHFHTDCWAEARATLQEEYRQRIRVQGVDALLGPYSGAAADLWDVAVEIPEEIESAETAMPAQAGARAVAV